jgi:hypothetical protein
MTIDIICLALAFLLLVKPGVALLIAAVLFMVFKMRKGG